MGQHLPTAILASYAILKQGGRILFGLRQNSGYCDGQWGLPAGHIEVGESFVSGLIREMKEELGIDLIPENIRLVHINHRKAEDTSERVNVFFLIESWSGEVENREPEKTKELKWFFADDLPELTIPYIRDTLEYIKKGIVYREEGW
ncbi:MAG: NUDIX domain-containing protein [Candidatus Moraniibacteriota bacterium]|nr:MAG: NUDIX domain-containing protein [Candidatus Moranbacteria bacterium]